MSLAHRCQHCFDQGTLDRGSRAFTEDSVQVLDVRGDIVEALANDPDGTGHEVNIDLSLAADGELQACCRCQRFVAGFLCKHVWAMILTLDAEGFGDLVPGTVPVDVTQDWNDGFDGQSSDLTGTTTKPAFAIPGSPLASPKRHHGPSTSWQNQLRLVSNDSQPRQRASEFWNELSSKRREVWYVLNASISVARQAMIVEFFQREIKKNGEWGKIRKLSISRDKIEGLSDPEDQHLVGILLGNKVNENDYGYYGRFMNTPGTCSSISVMPAMFAVVLPRLCATGRFVWLLDSSLPIEEAEPMHWDEGPPWKFRLVIESDERAECWRIRGRFYRDEETAELGDAIFATNDGLILFPGQLASLDGQRDFSWIDLLRSQTTVEVPFGDRERLLNQLSLLPHLPLIDMPENLRVEQVRSRPKGRLSIKAPKTRCHTANAMFAQVSFEYDGQGFRLEDERRGVFDAHRDRFILRDREQERALLDQLKEAGVRPARSYDAVDVDVEFHQRKLIDLAYRLTQDGWIVESEGIRIRQPGSFQLKVSSNVDWFELDGKLDFDGISASFPALLRALRSGDRYIRLDDGSQGMLPEQWLEKYGRLAKLAAEDGDTLRFSSSQALLLDVLLAEQENVQVDQPFEQFREKLRSFNGVKPQDEPRGFHGELRGYQREGVGWLEFLREFNFGGCLADDMGLGKTIQVLALLQSRRIRRLNDGETRAPSIVVVPKSLVFNWMDEAARFTPRLRVLNYTGADRMDLLAELPGYNLLVSTYGTLRRDIVRLKEIRFDYAILDESQAIKNHNSQAAKACRLLQADHRLAMTGTPVENHMGELWSLFEFLNPGMLGSSSAFAALAKNGRDAADSGLPLLAQALRPFMLRRTKKQVLSDLPEKTEQTLLCEMPPTQRKQYDELREYYRVQLSNRVEQFGLKKSKIHVLEALLRLRQAACHPGLLDENKKEEPSAKLDTLLEQLDEVLAEGHKALVFSQFTSLLAIVRKRLDDRKMVYEYLDGRTRKREDRVKRFQQDPKCPLFLISLKAGGQGLNLTAADYVFILDPWWNPAVEAQAVDRAHRIGQQRSVFAYRLICRDTVEEKILELQCEKRDLAAAIISADNSIIRDLTAQDLQLLLS